MDNEQKIPPSSWEVEYWETWEGEIVDLSPEQQQEIRQNNNLMNNTPLEDYGCMRFVA